jgi:hypothetical protein
MVPPRVEVGAENAIAATSVTSELIEVPTAPPQ